MPALSCGAGVVILLGRHRNGTRRARTPARRCGTPTLCAGRVGCETIGVIMDGGCTAQLRAKSGAAPATLGAILGEEHEGGLCVVAAPHQRLHLHLPSGKPPVVRPQAGRTTTSCPSGGRPGLSTGMLHDVSRQEREAAAGLLAALLAEVEEGRLSAESAHARRLLRRLEGVLIALEAEGVLSPEETRHT